LATKVLTPLAVKAAKPKRNAAGELVRAEYPDRGCAGMYLVVQSSGLKSWALRYRFDRKTRKLTLGAVADHEAAALTDALTLAGARKAAAAAKHLVEQGIDPAAQKQAAKANSAALAAQRAADGVEPLADQFLRLYAAPKTRPRTYQQTEDVLRRLVLPIWRGRTVHDIKRRDVIALVDDIAGERGPHMADKTLAVLGRWFSWLVGRDVIAVSPCLGVERPARDVPRERTLDNREIVTLWRACGEESVFGAFVRILLLTGCRRAEAAAMQWSELDEAQRLWSLPRERVKNGVPHAVPLAPQAWAIIAAQPRFVGSDFVFSNDGRRPIGGFSRSKRKLDERIKPAAPWCLHDARRTCASGMQRLGIRVEVVERCLNHTSGAYRGIAGVYMRDPMLEAKRESFEAWARHIEQLVSGEPAANTDIFAREGDLLVKAQTERERAIERIEAGLAASAAYHEAQRSAVTGRPPKPLTVEAISQAADAAEVPNTDLDFFARCVSSLVVMACGTAKRHKAWQASDLKNSAKRIEKAARELEVTIGKASEGAREYVRLHLPEPRPTSLNEHQKMVRELADAAKVASQHEPGEPWVTMRKLLIPQFLSDIERAGGRLTVSGDEGGTLFKTFEYLAPHLPEKFQVSHATLRRHWRKWRGSKPPGAEPK
jgi:integrase